jgi:hypothetical protein
MQTRFSLEGYKRKDLAKALAETLETEVNYLGMPSMSYRIGNSFLEKDGTMIWGVNFLRDDVERIVAELEAQGFETVKDSFTISFPAEFFTTETMQKLDRILESKGALIKKALNADRTTAERNIETVDFPWFDRILGADEAKVYTEFVSKLCQMAREQTRVLERETVTDNEKYSFRCFLLRLGYIGEEYKDARRMLLQNLSGSSAYRHSKEESREND